MQSDEVEFERLLPRWLFRAPVFLIYFGFLLVLNLSNALGLMILSLGRYLQPMTLWLLAMIGSVILGLMPLGTLQKLKEESAEEAQQILLITFHKLKKRFWLPLGFALICFFPSVSIWSNIWLDQSSPQQLACTVARRETRGEGTRNPEFFLTLFCPQAPRTQVFMQTPPMRYWNRIYEESAVVLVVHSGQWGLPYWVEMTLPPN